MFFSEAIANMEALLDLKGEVVKMLQNWCKVLTSCQREFLSLSPSIFPFTLHPLSPSLLHPSSLTQSKLLCLHERDGWKKKSKVSLKKFGGKNWRETLKTWFIEDNCGCNSWSWSRSWSLDLKTNEDVSSRWRNTRLNHWGSITCRWQHRSWI